MSSQTDTQRQGPDKFGVFVSHITEEAHLARRIKQHLERALPSSSAFVSAEDIRLGEDWRASLKRALDETKALVVLCSPRSIKRPWINFESGSGWERGVQVIPVCHGGLRKGDLPDPLGIFQVVELKNERDCRLLVETLGRVLGLPVAEGYDYQNMARTLFDLPERGADVGVVLTHGQDGWERRAYTLFNLPDAPPEGLEGNWTFEAVTRTDDLLSVDLHRRAGLVVGSPWRRRMSPEVVAALADFVKKGGRMLLLGFEMGDRHHDANLNDLAAEFGLYFEADIVGPPRQGASKPFGVAVDYEVGLGDRHALTEGLAAVRLANVQTLRVLPLGAEWLRVGKNVACRPSRETVEYRDGVFTEPGEKRVEPNAGAGWLAVAAEAPRGLCGEGAVQAVGTWDLLGRRDAFGHRDNLILLGRLFEWLSGRQITDSFMVAVGGD